MITFRDRKVMGRCWKLRPGGQRQEVERQWGRSIWLQGVQIPFKSASRLHMQPLWLSSSSLSKSRQRYMILALADKLPDVNTISFTFLSTKFDIQVSRFSYRKKIPDHLFGSTLLLSILWFYRGPRRSWIPQSAHFGCLEREIEIDSRKSIV